MYIYNNNLILPIVWFVEYAVGIVHGMTISSRDCNKVGPITGVSDGPVIVCITAIIINYQL